SRSGVSDPDASSQRAPKPPAASDASGRVRRASGSSEAAARGGTRVAASPGRQKRSDETADWGELSASSRAELEQLVEVLKSFKRGEFAVRFEYQPNGILSRAGELLNDIFGLTEH